MCHLLPDTTLPTLPLLLLPELLQCCHITFCCPAQRQH
jgi:hypothetical protein